MPTYDYECDTCNKVFEIFQSMSSPKLDKCPTCGSPVKRLIGAGAGIIFKGGGFYETDFKSKTGSKPKEDKPAAASSSTASTGECGGAKGDVSSCTKPGCANSQN